MNEQRNLERKVLYGLAGLTFIIAQVQLFNLKVVFSLMLTLSALGLMLLGWYLDRIMTWVAGLPAKLNKLKSAMDEWGQSKGKTHVSQLSGLPEPQVNLVEETPAPTADSEQQQETTEPSKPVWRWPWPQHALEIKIPTAAVLIIGGLLLAGGQPFLFLGAFLPAALMLVAGAFLLAYGLKVKTPYLELGKLELSQKSLWLALLGVAVMVLGDYLLFLFLQEGEFKEFIGLTIHVIGNALIVATFPKRLPDPEPNPEEHLEQYTGMAKTKSAVILKVLLVVISGVFFLLARGAAQKHLNSDHFIYLMAAVGALMLSFPWMVKVQRPRWSFGPFLTYVGQILRLGAVVVALMLAYQGQVLITHEQLTPALTKFLLAIIIIIVALGRPEKKPLELAKESPLAWPWEALGLVVILIGATWLRLHLLDVMPAGLEGDEAGTARNAQVITNMVNGGYRSLTAHWQSQPLFWLFPLNLVHHLFGLGNVGLRILPAFYGLLSIVAIHLIGRLYFGPRIGLALAALVAISRWHLHFSRFGWANTLMILMMTIGFYFLVKSFSDRKKWYLYLSGAAFAYAVQTETAGRLVPIICMVVLLYLFFVQKHFFKRHWKAVTILFLGAWLVGGAYFLLMAKKPYLLIQRVKEVSIFSEDPNAAPSAQKGFLDSAKLSFTMMNWHGDYRTRHNGGLSGEPMLDFWTAILFALGFGYTVYYWKGARLAIVLIWFLGGLSGSVFSIEAPQAHRSFGLFPALFLMIGYFLAKTQQLLRRVLGKPGLWIGAMTFGLLLIPAGKINYHKYFDTYPRFDPGFTEMARYVGSLGDNWLSLVSTYGWMGHPPFELYARTAHAQFLYSSFDFMPVTFPTDKNISFVTVEDRSEIIPSLQYYYPDGVYKDRTIPHFGTLVQSWNVTHKALMEVKGLRATYWSNGQWQGRPVLEKVDPDLNQVLEADVWPVKGTASAQWEGTLWIPHYRHYTFYLQGNSAIDMTLGTHHLQVGPGQTKKVTLALPGGLMPIRLRARHQGGTPTGLLSWKSDEAIDFFMYKCTHQQAFNKEPVPADYWFTYPQPTGLLATYYTTPDWSGPIRLQFVEPVIFTDWFNVPFGLPPPLSATWTGRIKIPKTGRYQFAVTSSGYTQLKINGQPVLVQASGAPAGWRVPSGPYENPVTLKAGSYPVEIRWSLQSYQAFFKLWWIPPDGKKAAIPTNVLVPEAK